MIGYECLVVKGSFRSLLLISKLTVYGSEGTWEDRDTLERHFLVQKYHTVKKQS